MSAHTTKQLYADLQRLAESGSEQLAADHMCELFNINLDDARKQLPSNPIVNALRSAGTQTRLGDLLVRTGQLKAALEE